MLKYLAQKSLYNEKNPFEFSKGFFLTISYLPSVYSLSLEIHILPITISLIIYNGALSFLLPFD